MKELKLLSWNVNGIRSQEKKGFGDWLRKENPDILCLQETKAAPVQLSANLTEPEGYITHWNYPEDTKGYSGVALFTKEKPDDVKYGFGIEKYDIEGRAIIAKYPEFTLLNIYFPKGDTREERRHRLDYKMSFYDAFLKFTDSLKGKDGRLIICGDFNTAHKPIDLARPKENEKNSGFLPEERAWMDGFISHGYIDTFRQFNKEPDNYTWWDMKTRARERNVGWRIDYFFVTENLAKSIKRAFIMSEVLGSDHCPIGIVLKI
jgi:exodeoxyribonuclease III